MIEKKGVPEGKYMNRYILSRIKSNKNFLLAITGSTGCISGDTFIKLNRGGCSRTTTIKEFWRRMSGNYKNKNKKIFDITLPSKIRSYDGEIIKLNKVRGVSFSGIKETYSLVLENGLSIKATKEHKVMTKKGWKELITLTKEDEVMCDTPNPNVRNRKRIRLRDIGLAVGKNHPYNIQPNQQISVHTLIYEAHLNNLNFLEYLDILLNEPEKCKTLKYINPKVYCIHHIDENHYNNSIENLELLSTKEHMLKHNNYTNFSQGLPKFSRVKNIEFVGKEETYDIETEEPHNFVANNIIVHNSGKTYSALKIAEFWYGEYFNRDFPLENICFSLEEVARRLKDRNLQRGELLLLEEAGANLGAMEFQSKISRVFTYILQSFRSMNIGLIMTLPVLTMLNKQARQLIHMHLTTEGIKEGKCKLKVKIHQLNQHTGKSYWKAPILVHNGLKRKMPYITYSIISQDLRIKYEKKKETFVYHLVDNFEENIMTKDNLKENEKKKRQEKIRQEKIELEKKRNKYILAHKKDIRGKMVCEMCESTQTITSFDMIKCRACGHSEVIKI